MYDNPNRIKYAFYYDFGSGADENFSITGPKGKAGTIYDYGVEGVYEVMNGTTVTPKVAVGTTSDPDAYGEEIVLNALADNSSTSLRQLYDQIADATSFNALLVDATIAADAEVYLTCTGATGSPTGQATAFVIIDWAK